MPNNPNPSATTPSAITFDFHDTLANCDDWFQLEIHHLMSAFLGWLARERGDSLDLAIAAAADSAYRRLRLSVHHHGHESPAERSVITIAKSLGFSVEPEEAERGIDNLMRGTLASATPVAGAVETVSALAHKGIPLGIVSSAVYHPFLLWTLDRFGIREAFSVVTTSASSGFYKSRPEVFWHALDRLEADPGKSIHIGDSLRFDVRGARRAGMRTVWLNNKGGQHEGTPPDLTLQSLCGAAPRLLTLLDGSTS